METNITLETLIEEQRKRIPRLKLTPVNSDLLGTIFSYKYEGEDYDAYCRWLEIAKRYLNIYFPNDKFVNEFEIISKQMINKSRQEKMLYILESLAAIPQTITDKIDDNKGDMKMNININNSQSQNQSLEINLFLDAIKNELTGRQIKELKDVVAQAGNNLQKAKPQIIDKLKSFGENVLSNIMATILTNSTIWSLL